MANIAPRSKKEVKPWRKRGKAKLEALGKAFSEPTDSLKETKRSENG